MQLCKLILDLEKENNYDKLNGSYRPTAITATAKARTRSFVK